MDGGVQAAIERAIAGRIERATPLGGGDLNDAYCLQCESGRTVFAKTNRRANPQMFPAEARGLDWLRAANALRIPEVIAVSSGEPDEPPFLLLEYLPPGRPARRFDEQLGHGLAALHHAGAPTFGLDHDNFVGQLPQPNAPAQTWADFYRDQRLAPQLDRAVRSGVASQTMRRGLARLFERLEEWIGPAEPPARLHGDLWGGNLHTDADGAPVLIDPAVYGGHREVDLAMMRLFGGFSRRVFEAYEEAYPLAPGHEDRVALYQLYPLLVHVNHFGGGYVASVECALARYV